MYSTVRWVQAQSMFLFPFFHFQFQQFHVHVQVYSNLISVSILILPFSVPVSSVTIRCTCAYCILYMDLILIMFVLLYGIILSILFTILGCINFAVIVLHVDIHVLVFRFPAGGELHEHRHGQNCQFWNKFSHVLEPSFSDSRGPCAPLSTGKQLTT